MASFMSSIIDVLVTDVMEYLGGPVPAAAVSSPPPSETNKRPPVHHIPQLVDAPSKHKRDLGPAFSHLTGYIVATVLVVILLLVMLCRRCHPRKRARVAFAGVPNHSQNMGLSSCRRIHVSSLTVHSKFKSVDNGVLVNRYSKGDSEPCETAGQNVKSIACCTSCSADGDPGPKNQPGTDVCKVKEGVKRKLDEGAASATVTGRKNSQCVWINPQKVPKDSPRRQHQHGYTYASPKRKTAEVGKSANTNLTSYQSDDISSRWKGNIPKSRLNKMRCRYARETLQTSLKRSSARAKDLHLRRQRNTNHGAPVAMLTSSVSSPLSRPLYPHSLQSPQRFSRNYHSRSSPEKRKLVKRSKTLASGADDSSGIINSKLELQKGKQNYKMYLDCMKAKETKHPNPKSPKKVKKSSVLLKGKKVSGQRKTKKARKKHKFTGKVKSKSIEFEKGTFPEKRVPENFHFPEHYGDLHVPAVVRQATTKGARAESFTIKRTATPVLSSLLGQGAFRTCWPQGDSKSVIHTQGLDGNGNTGRHNTHFLGPTLPDCNNEASETVNYSQRKTAVFWNKCKHDAQKHGDNTDDTTANAGLVFSDRVNPHHNNCFHIPNFQTSERPLEAKDCRNIFNVVNNPETHTVCQNLRLEETRKNNDFKNTDNQRSEQFCALSQTEQMKQETEYWSSSNKLLFTSASPPDDLNEKGRPHSKLKVQPPKVRITEDGKISKEYEWNWTSQCQNLTGSRHRTDLRIPGTWTHGDKTIRPSDQLKDTDVTISREELGKRYFMHDTQCSQQFPCVSYLTCHQDNRQGLSNTDTLLREKQHVNSIKQSNAKTCLYNTDKLQTAALSQYTENVIPVDLKEFRNLWKTKVTQEGNVFRLTRNHKLPSRLTYDNPGRLQESLKHQTRHEVIQNSCDMWQGSGEDSTLSVCYHAEEKKACPTRAAGLRKDMIHECSKQLDSTHAKYRSNQLTEETHPESRVRRIKDDHKCLENNQAVSFGTGYAQKLAPRLGKSSTGHERLANAAVCPAAEEWADFGIRVYDRLNQSNSSVPTTVDGASGVDSDSPAHRQLGVKEKLPQSKQVGCSHCLKNQVDKQVQDTGHLGDCRNHVVTCHGRDVNHVLAQDNKHAVKCTKREPSDKPTEKASVFHGHVVKRTKSLISVRNMLNELTSHLRANHGSCHPTAPTHVRKRRGKTLFYLKPTRKVHKDPNSLKEHGISSIHKSTYCPVLRCSNIAEVTGNHQRTGKYVTCYRPRKFKSYRHEPYRKRVPTSSDSTVTPSSGYYWTKNKNNCSPSRKGRYVLGPLVDKHVFPEEEHNSEAGTVEESGSNSVVRQEDNGDTVSGAVRYNTRKPIKTTLDNTNVKHSEADYSDVEQKTEECENVMFAAPVFPKTRRIPADGTDKDHIDFWSQATSEQPQLKHAPIWAATTAQPINVSNAAQADPRRIIRRHTDAGHSCQAETRYKIIRQCCAAYPETSHTIKRHVSTGYATKGGTATRYMTKMSTATRNKRSTHVESVDIGSEHTRTTSERHNDRADTARYDNHVDHVTERNESFEETNTEQTKTEDTATGHRRTERSATRQKTLKKEAGNAKYMTDTAKLSATKNYYMSAAAHIPIKKCSEVETEAECSQAISITNEHPTKQNAGFEEKETGGNPISRDQDRSLVTVFCSANDLKSTGSLNIGEKTGLHNEIKSNQFKRNMLQTAKGLQTKVVLESGVNELTNNDSDKRLFFSTVETLAPKPKATVRMGCSRYQYNRFNMTKKQIGLARLKAARGPLSFRHSASFERNLKSLKVEDQSRRARGWQFKSTTIRATQSHTTQTENSINSAHVAVQTSPGLQATARRTPHHCKIRYLANPRLSRDKITQKECVLSRHRLFRKPSVNVQGLLSSSASKPVQDSRPGHLTDMHLENQSQIVLGNRDDPSVNHNITAANTGTAKQFELSAVHIRRQQDLSVDHETDDRKTRCNDHTYTPFEGRSRSNKAPNSQDLQEARWNETRDAHINFATEKEFTDKLDPVKQDTETAIDSRRWDENRKERTFILELSNTPFSGTQNQGNHDSKPLQTPHVDNKEKEKFNAGKSSCQANRDVQVVEVIDEPKLSTAGDTSRNRLAPALESSDSSALSSRLSELNKFCVIRPIWKNANIEEIDRRVRRALKLREELKQSGSSGNRARSLIASYFEASAAENIGKSSDGVRSGTSSTFVSDLDSANKSTYPISRDQRTAFQDTGSDDTLCQNVDHTPIAEGRSSSSEDNHTKQGDTVSESVVTEAAQTGTSLRWAHRKMNSTDAAEQSSQENTVCENEHLHGRHSRAEYSFSFREETASESTSRVEVPSSERESHRPSNSNSGNSIKRAAMKNKNSPPTKISKVENICHSTPRLVGALVQTLPQVPLTSFVEWFIETSDPNNFLPSDRPSSSSDNSPGDSAHCTFEDSTPVEDQASSNVWQTMLFNEPQERDGFCSKNKEVCPAGTASHKKSYLLDQTCHQPEEHIRTSFFDGTKPKCYKDDRMSTSCKRNIPKSLSSAFPSTPSSATYGMSTLSGDTQEQSDLTRNSDTENRGQRTFLEAVKEANILNYQLKLKGDENPSDNIMKGTCTKFASKRINRNSLSFSNIKSKHWQTERSNIPRQISSSASKQLNVPTEVLTTPDSFNKNSPFQPSDSCTYSHPVSKVNIHYLPHSTDDATSSGQITHSESTEESAYCSKGNRNKTDRVDSEVARNQDGITNNRITRAHEENPRTETSVDSACTSEQGDVTDRQIIRDIDEDNRCAPGIRHILMKLRQTTDVDETPAPRAERTKITLRKCSDVTGIIAKFQNTQP